ncbi:dihydrofolate reductase family protein [Filimonas effusa]|uniref:Bacterial bifunctional deaminase-reductase C-terminal domain-containing protein n=1 Tax=Filimonas effusa TaxID=2508721 RepID=A0A4Q1DBP5_9BACT|nr:dihydrofolate reductase family protein [Filimonas effusa]RXK86881.1 hypothetical protein ESB13_08855 [Filimonas effusa]
MKIVLIANVSMNGRVLLSDNPHHQLPKEAMAFYLKLAKQVGNLVIGVKTFKNFLQFPDEVKELFKGIEIVVLSMEPFIDDKYAVVRSPDEAIRYLGGKGFNEVAVGGGTGAFNAFLDADLVTDVYFNISPVITGSGGVLGSDMRLNTRFKVEEYKLHEGFLQLYLTRQ